MEVRDVNFSYNGTDAILKKSHLLSRKIKSIRLLGQMVVENLPY